MYPDSTSDDNTSRDNTSPTVNLATLDLATSLLDVHLRQLFDVFRAALQLIPCLTKYHVIVVPVFDEV